MREAEPARPSPPRVGETDGGRPAVLQRTGGRQPIRPAMILLVAVTVLALFAGAAVAFSLLVQPKVYGGEAEFLLTTRPDLSDAAVDRASLTQVEIITGPRVLQPVADQTHVRLPALEDAVSADMVGRTNILRITVGDRDPARAISLTRAIAAQYGALNAAVAKGDSAQPTATVLTPARATDQLLQPRPRRALAAGALLGLLAAAAAVLVLWRPWQLTRPSPFWS
jgi:capsular polysaccharide biosynthesis protein